MSVFLTQFTGVPCRAVSEQAINESIKNKFAVRTSSSTMGTFWTEQGHLIFHSTLLPQVSSLQSVDIAMLFQAFGMFLFILQAECFSLVCYVTQDLRADTTARGKENSVVLQREQH